eukprot:1516524-Alexandrium_andersonii.AAC.1
MFASNTPGSVSAVAPLLRGRGGLLPRGTQALPGALTAFRQVVCSGRRLRAQPGLWVSSSRRVAHARGTGAPPAASLIFFAHLLLGH